MGPWVHVRNSSTIMMFIYMNLGSDLSSKILKPFFSLGITAPVLAVFSVITEERSRVGGWRPELVSSFRNWDRLLESTKNYEFLCPAFLKKNFWPCASWGFNRHQHVFGSMKFSFVCISVICLYSWVSPCHPHSLRRGWLLMGLTFPPPAPPRTSHQ